MAEVGAAARRARRARPPAAAASPVSMPLGQVDPVEVAALAASSSARPRGSARAAPPPSRRGAALQPGRRALDVGLEPARPAVRRERRLGERVRADEVFSDISASGADQPLGQHQVAGAHARRDRLGERRASRSTLLAAVQLVQRRHRLALEPQQAVGVVLDQDQHLVLARQLDQAPPALARAATRRTGSGRSGSGRAAAAGPLASARLERVDVDARRRQRHRPDVGAERAQRDQRAVVGRRPRRPPRRPGPGRGAGRGRRAPCSEPFDQQHAAGVDAVALADPLAQRPVAAGRVRAARATGSSSSARAAAGSQVVHRQHVGGGDAAGERDRGGGMDPAYRMPPPAPAGSRSAERSRRPRRSARPRWGCDPTRMPRASSASFLAWAVPDEPEMIAPAWPIVLPAAPGSRRCRRPPACSCARR